MTEITDLYIGNRSSGKTQKLIEDLSQNLLHDRHSHHVIFSKSLRHQELMQRLPNFHKPKITISDKYNIEKLWGIRSSYIYLDELDLADREPAINLVNNLSMGMPKRVHVNASPMFLRDKKDLNVNHTSSSDPLIRILQITDFNFHFLFNEKTARTYYNTFFSSNKERVYTEGLGMISLFD